MAVTVNRELRDALGQLGLSNDIVYFALYRGAPSASVLIPDQQKGLGLLVLQEITLGDGSPAVGSYWLNKARFEASKLKFERLFPGDPKSGPEFEGYVASTWPKKTRSPSFIKLASSAVIGMAAVVGALTVLIGPVEFLFADSDLSFEPQSPQLTNVVVGEYVSYPVSIVNHARTDSDVIISSAELVSGNHIVQLAMTSRNRYRISSGGSQQITLAGYITAAKDSPHPPRLYELRVTASSTTGRWRSDKKHNKVLQSLNIWSPRAESKLTAFTDSQESDFCHYQLDLYTGKDIPGGLKAQASIFTAPVQGFWLDGVIGVRQNDEILGQGVSTKIFITDPLLRFQTYRFDMTVDFSTEEGQETNSAPVDCASLLKDDHVRLEFSSAR